MDGPGQDDDIIGVGEESHHRRPDPNAWIREQANESGVEWLGHGLLSSERLVPGLVIICVLIAPTPFA